MPDLAERPWEGLPRATADALRPGFPTVADEIIDAIRSGVPAYARPLEGSFGEGVRLGVGQALTEFAALIENPGMDRSQGRGIYVALGRGEAREGRSMEALLAAYRIGARVAWRRVAETAREAGLPSETLALLAESIFAYIDELSAYSAEGFAQEQAAEAGELDRRRERLVGVLTSAGPAERAAVEEVAREAGWRLPATLAVLVWEPGRRRIVPRLPAGTIAAQIEELTCAVIPDPVAPGRRRELEAALGGHPAAIGPAVDWTAAALSADRARATHRLVSEELIAADGGLAVADEHLATLILHCDETLLADLAERRLEPLTAETPKSQLRLRETLLAWLEHQGNVGEVAAALHVHSQTVRYRLGRLRERFGDELDKPQARFELGLALRRAKAGQDGA
jgi:hypothetical protein